MTMIVKYYIDYGTKLSLSHSLYRMPFLSHKDLERTYTAVAAAASGCKILVIAVFI